MQIQYISGPYFAACLTLASTGSQRKRAGTTRRPFRVCPGPYLRQSLACSQPCSQPFSQPCARYSFAGAVVTRFVRTCGYVKNARPKIKFRVHVISRRNTNALWLFQNYYSRKLRNVATQLSAMPAEQNQLLGMYQQQAFCLTPALSQTQSENKWKRKTA